MSKKRYFVDMDGVLAKYEFNLPSYDMLYEEGYFLNRPMQPNIVDAVCQLLAADEDVYVLSAVLKDSEYALFEKHEWLDRHMNIACRRRLFTICGEDKINFVPAFNPETDILVDDYGPNCKIWADHGGRYVKVSVDAKDAEYEKTRHDHVINPDMPAQKILNQILAI